MWIWIGIHNEDMEKWKRDVEVDMVRDMDTDQQ